MSRRDDILRGIVSKKPKKTVLAPEAEEGDEEAKEERAARSVRRRSCPFHGFIGFYGKFADTRTNVCGLVANDCIMPSPDWGACVRRNSAESSGWLDRLLASGTVFPDELRPERRRGRTWSGIRLQDWLTRVVRDHDPPQTA